MQCLAPSDNLITVAFCCTETLNLRKKNLFLIQIGNFRTAKNSYRHIIQHLVFHENKIREVRKKTMLWNRNDLLRFRFLLWKSFGFGFGFGFGSGSSFAFSILEAALFPRGLKFLIFPFLYYILCRIRV